MTGTRPPKRDLYYVRVRLPSGAVMSNVIDQPDAEWLKAQAPDVVDIQKVMPRLPRGQTELCEDCDPTWGCQMNCSGAVPPPQRR